MTVKKNPFKYLGSGKYWKLHYRKHGREFIQTKEIWGFDTQELCSEFALRFSEENDIVKSSEWANLIIEDGLHQFSTNSGKTNLGKKFSDETRKKMSESNKGKIFSDESRKRMSIAQRNKPPVTEETRRKLSESHKGCTVWNKNIKNCFSEEWIRKCSERTKGKNNPRYGIKLDDVTKAKIGDKSRGTSWFNDGIRNYKIKPENALQLGYHKGRIKKPQNH
jgi:hypothetical protein